ncbi:MAG: hypothetical protein ACK40G_17465 [Cytophagaceae bacterium]
MMKKTIVYLTAFLFLIACSKEKQTPGPESKKFNYLPMKLGNYWVYESYQTDTNGVEKNIRIDSIYLASDTVINNQKYFFFSRESYSNTIIYPGLIGDSMGYLLHHRFFNVSNKILSPSEKDTFYRSNELSNVKSFVCCENSPIMVPAGIFNSTVTFKSEVEHKYVSGNEKFARGETFIQYANNIGIIRIEDYYLPDSRRRVGMRLVRYFVH